MEYSLNNVYDTSIEHISNYKGKNLFYVNKTTNCLSLNINSEINLINNSFTGFHLMKIIISDSMGGSDSMLCKIYLIESSSQKMFLTTAKDSQTVRENLQEYKK